MAIGTVRALVGETTATDSRGNTRVLRVGDTVELNETVQSSVGSTILIQFDNGGFATVGSGDRLFLDQSVIDPMGVTQPLQTAQGNEQSVEDIQAMIAAGMDPTQIAEATAAGADAGTAGDPGQGGHTFVVVNQEAARAEVTPGLATDTFGSTFNPAATQIGTVEPRFLINPDAEPVNNGPVIDLEASIASGQVREAGVRGDDATLAGDSPNTAYDGKLVASGQIVATDPDGDTLSYTVKPAGTEGEGGASADGQYGSLTIDASGNYVYNLDDRANGLSQGDSVTETFTVMVSDGRGGLVSQEITITVNGTNDAPTLTMGWGATGNGVTEDVNGSDTVTGSWSVSDADADGSRQTISIEGKDGTAGEKAVGDIGDGNALSFETGYGKLTLNPDGTYSYALNNDSDAVQKLGQGETRTETFEITTTDAHGSTHTQTITVVVTGTNDAPVITDHGSGSLYLKETGVGTVEQGGKPGWAPGDHNHAIAGISKAESSFTVKDVDANDALSARLVDASGNPVAGTSVDANGVITLVTDYGTLTVTPAVNADGSVTYTYSFELNGNADSLNEGQSFDFRYKIEVSDGHGGTVSENVNIKIDGTNDAPVMRFESVHVKESGEYDGQDTTLAGGNDGFVDKGQHRFVVHGDLSLRASDVDAGSKLTYGIDLKGGNMTLETASTGGKPVTDADGNKVTVPVEIMSNTTVDGIQTIVTNYGTFTLDTASGKYTFELNTSEGSPANELAAGEFLNLGFTSSATDQFGAIGQHTVRVTIEGSNDVPTLTVDKPLDVSYQDTVGTDGIVSVSGTAHGSDADHGAKLTYSFGNDAGGNPITSVETPYGTMTIDPQTGEYTFTVKNGSLDQLEGKDAALDFNVRVTDEHGAHADQTVTVNVHGNRAPEIVQSGDDDLTVKESGVVAKGEGVPDNGWAEGQNQTKAPGILTDGSSFTVKDQDTGKGDSLKAVIVDKDGNPLDGVVTDAGSGKMTLVTEYGTLTVTPTHNADGSVTYDYKFDLDDKAANNLAQGEHVDLGYKIQVFDNSGSSVSQDVNVRVEGTNDNPNVGGTQVHAKDQGVYNGNNETGDDDRNDGNMGHQYHRDTVEGKVPFGDKDNGSELKLEASLADTKQHGNLDSVTTGVYTGEGNGKVPVVDAEGKPLMETVRVLESSTHTDETSGHTIQVIKTSYGDLVLDTATGEYSFTLNRDAADHLGQDEKISINFRVTATDEYGAQGHHDYAVGITIEGANDRPTLSLDNPGTGVSDSVTELAGTAHGADVDNGAKLSYSFGEDGKGNPILEKVTEYGKITIDPNTGKYTYELDTDSEAYKGLEGKTDSESITIRVSDEHGAYNEQTLTVNVTGSSVTPPPGPENHAPEVGDASLEVKVTTDSTTVTTDDNRIVAGDLSNGDTSASISGVDRYEGNHTNHAIFKDHNNGVSYEEAIKGAEKVDSLKGYLDLINGENCPDVIVIDNTDGSFVFDSAFRIPEGKTVIVEGDCVIENGAHFNNSGSQSDAFSGLFYVTGDMIIEKGSFHPGSGPYILVQGTFEWHGNVKVEGSLETTVETNQTEVRIDLNDTFTDQDGDKLTFTVDGHALPDGYQLSLVNGILTITGIKDVPFGNQTITVTAEDGKGGSTSASFDITVNGDKGDVTVSPVDPAETALFDTTMLSAMDTGAEHVMDPITHQPLDGNHRADTVDGMIAAADTVEHGTTGHDMLTGSHGHDVLYGEGGHDLLVGDGSGSTVEALADLVHTDSSSESVLNTIHSMSPEQLKGLSDGLETLEHHNDGNDVLMGGAGHDVLIGMGGNDVLHGGEGNDILLGGSGDDILVGGQGDDVLVGGSGHDTFQYHQGDLDGVVNGDHIADFHLGNLDASKGPVDPNADVLDVGDLLLASGAKADGSDLFSGGFLNLEVISHDEEKGTATVKLSIDQDGSEGGEHGSVALATIDMNGVTGLGGLNPQNQAEHLMQQLMNNESIKI